jgi:L-seryl-tRNA(Ser) seleniumtransferase
MALMDKQSLLRALPKVDELLKRGDVVAMLQDHPRALVLESLREVIEATRAAIQSGGAAEPDADAMVRAASEMLAVKAVRSLRRVINATGIIVHTNLGRAPLAPSAVEAVADVARGYSTLEYDVASAERGSRHVHVEELLCRLTGAEAAMAVNNNAAAVLLGLAGLAAGKEAIVSRGQLVEIGGSFRIPDIMRESGARMVEVGATNKTRIADYEAAVTRETGLLLKVHSSNFRMVGFTEEASLAELVGLGAAHGIPVFEDQGSGVLVDLAVFGLPGEPTVHGAIAAGADLVSFSGDKLLGGPQAGLMVGKWHVIDKLKRHPLARALRCDKMTLAALAATLRLYLDPERAVREIPVQRMLTQPVAEVAQRSARLADGISHACGEAVGVMMADDVSRAGGGALPMADVPTVVVALTPRDVSVVELESRLRLGDPAVIARISEDRLLLDPRTLTDAEELEVTSAVARAVCGAGE